MKKVLILLFIVFTTLIAEDIQAINVEVVEKDKIVKITKTDRNNLYLLTIIGNDGNITIEIKNKRIKKGDDIMLMVYKGKSLRYNVNEFVDNGIVVITGDKAEEILYSLYDVDFLHLYINDVASGSFVITRLGTELRKYQKYFGTGY